MASNNTLFSPLVLLFLSAMPLLVVVASAPSSFFSTYIGAQFTGIKFSDVPIDQNVDEFHFILSFAIDYTATGTPTPTNGKFDVFWDSTNLSPSEVTAVKKENANVRVALSIGGNSVRGRDVLFRPVTVDSWLRNAVSSLTRIIKTNNLDGIDIDYEHFDADPDTFAECIGRLVTTLKKNGVISFASIAPFDKKEVQRQYQALWKKYGKVIDFVNFQFYAYDKSTTVSQFLRHLEDQRKNYKGGKILVSYATDGFSGGLSPETGFFNACTTLQKQGELDGIFVWSADDSQDQKFRHEKKSQDLLKNAR